MAFLPYHSIFAFDVNALDSLRVVCGEADEYDHADRRNDELQGGGLQEDIHEPGKDDTDEAHEQERPDA